MFRTQPCWPGPAVARGTIWVWLLPVVHASRTTQAASLSMHGRKHIRHAQLLAARSLKASGCNPAVPRPVIPTTNFFFLSLFLPNSFSYYLYFYSRSCLRFYICYFPTQWELNKNCWLQFYQMAHLGTFTAFCTFSYGGGVYKSNSYLKFKPLYA